VTFDCPGCGELCAFPVRHAGRRARCLRCQARFIIPDHAGATVRRVDPDRREVMIGQGQFLRESGRDIFRALVQPRGMTVLVFLASLVCFRFFLANADFSAAVPGFALVLPVGWVVIAVTWGLQLWAYMEIIGTTFLDLDTFTAEELGGTWGLIWVVAKNLYQFLAAVLVALLPGVLATVLLRNVGVPLKAVYWLPWLGLIWLPMMLLILGTDQEWYWVFALRRQVQIMRRVPGAYAAVLALLLAAALLEVFTQQYGQLTEAAAWVRWAHLAGNLAAMGVSVTAMRAIGLFGRCYADLLPWLE